MNAGFILLYRQITEWEWYQNPNTFRVFLHCLLKANFVDGRFEGVAINRGQFVTSLPNLAKQTKLSIQQVRTALDHLKLTGEITDKAYPKFRVITVVKYDEYQRDNRQDNSQSTGNQQASNRPAPGQQQQYNNNNNVIREKDNCDDDSNDIFTISSGEIEKRIREDQEIEEAALSIGLTVSPTAIERARNLVFRYGLDNVLDAIKASVDVPKWSYVEGVLRKRKKDEEEINDDREEHENSIKQVLINRGEWDEEYQCHKDKAEKYRQQGLTPEEAQEEMERERMRREKVFCEIASRASRAGRVVG